MASSHVNETYASMPMHPDLHDDAWDQKIEAQRMWEIKTGKKPVSDPDVGAAARRPSNPSSVLSDLQTDTAREDLIDETGIASPSATAEARPARTHGSRSADIPLETPPSPVTPIARTDGRDSSLAVDQDHSLSIRDPKYDAHHYISGEDHVSSSTDRHQGIQNYEQTSLSANVFVGRVIDDLASGTAGIKQKFRNVNLSNNSSVHFGNVVNHFGPNIFGGLHALQLDSIDDAAVKYRDSRATTQSVSNLPIMPIAYMPHASVKQPELKRALIRIAVVCQALDSAFAEYFRVVISPLQGTEKKIRRLREQICSRQSGTLKYVGPFGEYCERVHILGKSDTDARFEKYQNRATGDDVQPYLQDALEVPYWNMMADQFIKSNHINDQLTYDAILSVINDKRRELKLRLQQAKEKWPNDLPQEIEDGVNRRITVLEAVLAQTSERYDSLEEQQVQALQRSPTSGPGSTNLSADPSTSQTSSLTAKTSTADGITDLEKVSLLSLFFLFTAIAMVPFAMGFAGNWNAQLPDAVGSASDPDFKWLIATTLLAILGNIYAIVPLRKITRGSTANLISQVFLYFSILLGIFSISVYPFWNKAWSSSLSFFCNYFAIGSVFISAQHTSDTATGGTADASKIKKE